jgi:hypothetical protein
MARRRFVAASILILSALAASACAKSGAEEVVADDGGEAVQSTAGGKGSGTGSAPAPVLPLLGIAADDGEAAVRPAVVVKIDNDPNARPQSGLNQADLVYEIEVEGITRFAAVFQSTDVDQVGPVRSARSSDIDLIAALKTPYYAWSGANPTVTGEVNGAAANGWLIDVGHDALPAEFWRDNSRYAPFNLYSSTTGLRAAAPGGAGAPRPIFGYRSADEGLPESDFGASGVALAYHGDGRITNVEFAWDPELEGWARFQDDLYHDDGFLAHEDLAGEQIAPENVVILMVEYGVSAAGGSPQALSVGTGPAIVLTGESRAVEGTWSRSANTEPFTLTSEEGDEIRLTPGRTWVLLPQVGEVTYLGPERAEHLLTMN